MITQLMKMFLGILGVAVVLQTSCFAQLIQIMKFERNGTLGWLNPLCTTMPVYEVLRADSVTGPWNHAAYVTNATTYQLPVTIPSGSAAFYRIVWTNDVPVAMDYAFDEGFGFSSIVGQLTLNFASLSASWNFEDLGFGETDHPLGPGSGPIGYTPDLRTWAIVLRPDLDNTIFLAGTLESSSTGSGCEYTAYVGLVFRSTITGTEQIGDFVATKQ
jgi:hypothetical protein